MSYIKFHFLHLILFASLMFAGCNSEPEPPLTREKFKNVLMDIHLTEGIVKEYGIESQLKDDKDINIYSYVLKKHNISRADLETTIVYYTKFLDEYYEIYKEIDEEFRLKNDSILVTAENDKKPDTEKDTETNLWKLKKRWSLPRDGLTNPITFKLREPKQGKYTLSADIKLYPDDGSVSQRMTILIKYKDNTQEENSVGNIKKAGKYEHHKVFIQTDTTRDISTITCWVLNHSQGTKMKHGMVKNIKLIYEAFQKK